jgi:hypothetical protein
MPGSIKVSGAYRTIAAPYAKVSGTWRAVSVAYVKVEGTWRQWYAANITDNFDRSDASSLGTVSNGVTSWENVTGTWEVVSNRAQASTGTYPVAKVNNPLGSADYELKLDTPSGNGSGLAFWVTNTNNWYGVTTETSSSTSYSCPSGGTLSGTTCTVSSNYTATATTVNCGNYYSYDCSYPATVSYSSLYMSSSCFGCTGEGGNGGTLQCVNGACYEVNIPGYTCPNGGTATGIEPNVTCVKTCSDCGTGGSDSCRTCTVYSCPSGGTLSGTTCFVSSTYSATATTTHTNTVKLIQRASGTVSTLATHTTNTSTGSNTSPTLSLKVNTSNNLVTFVAYTGAGQTGTSYTYSYSATSPTVTASAGMVSTTSGIPMDNFGLK